MMKNHKLACAIGDAGWHGFIMKLEYKAQAAGRHLIKLDQWFASSKLCSDCGHKMPDMPLHQRQVGMSGVVQSMTATSTQP